jgi:homospermidine synthase
MSAGTLFNVWRKPQVDDYPHSQFAVIEKKILLVGFGCIGQAILPLLFRHLDIKPHQISIVTKNEDGKHIAQAYGVDFI